LEECGLLRRRPLKLIASLLNVTIPNELGGTIIGKGGERINRIREESGAHIVVEPQQPNSEYGGKLASVSCTQVT
uniref:K Homology domain-containing protein n=1 Tax=Parascaris equorum TaxID=6256 RepID=A0A914RM71_PAREQ